MGTPEEERRIDDYFRKRLMPVDSAIPELSGIDRYGSSVPAGRLAVTCLNILTFNNVTTFMLGSSALYAFPRSI